MMKCKLTILVCLPLDQVFPLGFIIGIGFIVSCSLENNFCPIHRKACFIGSNEKTHAFFFLDCSDTEVCNLQTHIPASGII